MWGSRGVWVRTGGENRGFAVRFRGVGTEDILPHLQGVVIKLLDFDNCIQVGLQVDVVGSVVIVCIYDAFGK